MIHNFADVPDDEDTQDFTPIPAGRYLCEVTKATPGTSKNGNVYWALELTVKVGSQMGRKVFDNVTFAPAAYRRTKLVLKRLGVDVSSRIDDAKPGVCLGKQAHVDVIVADEIYNGETRKRNRVPFAGYTAIETTDDAAPPVQATAQPQAVEADDGVPF